MWSTLWILARHLGQLLDLVPGWGESRGIVAVMWMIKNGNITEMKISKKHEAKAQKNYELWMHNFGCRACVTGDEPHKSVVFAERKIRCHHHHRIFSFTTASSF